jgi:hypothetical protein
LNQLLSQREPPVHLFLHIVYRLRYLWRAFLQSVKQSKIVQCRNLSDIIIQLRMYWCSILESLLPKQRKMCPRATWQQGSNTLDGKEDQNAWEWYKKMHMQAPSNFSVIAYLFLDYPNYCDQCPPSKHTRQNQK